MTLQRITVKGITNSRIALSIMILDRITPSVMTLSAMALSRIILSRITHNRMLLSGMTVIKTMLNLRNDSSANKNATQLSVFLTNVLAPLAELQPGKPL
jgi:hypothetical protein